MLVKKYPSSVALWLFISAVMVVMMVMVGGLTRLTESGLSMTSWKPITGWIPPLTEQAWQDEFSAYQQSPEFKQINSYMGLEHFKDIFWLEFVHRLLGRITGLVFLIPLLYFIYRHYIDRPLALKLTGIFMLGAIQAVVGWYMVKSGLKDQPYVSHYWLAGHLLMATVILACILRIGLGCLALPQGQLSQGFGLKIMVRMAVLLTFVQIMLGAFVAGLDAGLVADTFPDMNGQWVPDDLWILKPWYHNMLENPMMVQFQHRIMAYILALWIGILAWRLVVTLPCKSPLVMASWLLMFVLVLQITLGILTVIHQVPLVWASLHQLMAMILFAILWFIDYSA